jgi:hypothetical protein
MPKKLECMSLASLSSLLQFHTLAYLAPSHDMKKMKRSEYNP